MLSTGETLAIIEQRFKTVTGLKGRLDSFPLKKADDLSFGTDRSRSREHAEVFTPPYIVDEMLQTVPNKNGAKPATALDLCAGHGQFSIRILRKMYEEQGESFKLREYLTEKLFFAELQTDSCYKLLWIFSGLINLAIGDALQLGKLPKGWRGVWLYVEGLGEWVNITGFVRALRAQVTSKGMTYKVEEEQEFVKVLDGFTARLNHICKEPKMEIKQVAATKAGRQLLQKLVQEAASGVEVNWQNVSTPEWVVREMVKTVPDLKDLKRILVLFNIEFVEQLVKVEGIRASRIDFGSDSPIEVALAEKVYGVKTFSIGKNFEEMKAALDSRVGQYDVVFSNPPYQTKSDSQKDMSGDGSSHASPVYNLIVEYTIDVLKPQYVSMITPSRWMAGGRGLDDYRVRMLKDKHIRMIQDFPAATGPSAVFDGANLPGGVCYFLWDKNYDGPCEFNGIQRDIGELDIVVRNNTSLQILRKIRAQSSEFCDQRVLPTIPFGLNTNFNGWVDKNTPCATPCYARKRELLYVKEDDFTDFHGVRSLWKVYGARGTGYNGEVFSREQDNIGYRNVFLGEKGTICTQTYIVLASFKTKNEAENYEVYTQTKFFQFMLSLRVISQMVSADKFSWVPDLGDYSKAWTDDELYAHFGLTKKEIEHIEKSIKTP